MNKKIKIIDLLNKIANGEKDLPRRIRIQEEYTFELHEHYEHYYYNENVEITDLINHNFSNLNEEIEILEDNTEEIEETNLCYVTCVSDFRDMDIVKILNEFFEKNDTKINEIIRALNKIRKEKE